MRATLLLLLLCSAACPLRAHARVERIALIVANDLGDAGDEPLRYAKTDAQRVYDVLRELGDFMPSNMVLLRDENADTVRSTLIALNDRIRALVSTPDTQVLLMVYYSGHADAESLHMGRTRLSIDELTQLARGSAATFRLLVLDACRSGAITRRKGGRVVAPFPILEEHRLPNDGLAFLTASADDEDAQESDELRGSFFTHAFVSGLLGAADRDGDGSVVLDEAYRYAYQATMRATSRSFAGTQHPSFRYDFRGQGDLVLTQPHKHSQERARLTFPSDLAVLLLQNDESGTVVAELAPSEEARTLSVRAGRYFVRGRGSDVLYEGTIDARAGTVTQVAVRDLPRFEYAHLVRKGGHSSGSTHGPELGLRARTPLSNAQDPCIGAFVGYGFDWRTFGVRARLSACTSRRETMTLRTTTNAYDLELRVHHAWDFAWLSVELGLGAGATLFTQRYETAGRAPSRTSLTPFSSVGLTTLFDLSGGTYAGVDAAAETFLLRLQDRTGSDGELHADFGVRMSLLAGKHF